MDLIPLADLRPDSLQWLWPNRLPEGKLAILDGDPGTGKSVRAPFANLL
jgi:putative DNA primase/helicase